MTKKRIFAILFSVLAFSAVVGASLANAAGSSPTPPAVVEDADSVDHQCPPDCTPADKAEEATEAQGTEDANEAPGESDGPGGHEDPAGNADHQFDGEE